MEERCKHVIQLHRQFLTKNIVWTDDLVKALQDENLLPDSVYRAIQVNCFKFTKVNSASKQNP